MKIQTVNPATETVLSDYETLDLKQVNHCIENAHTAFLSWKKTAFNQRQDMVLTLSHLLSQQKKELAILIAQEMGKPVTAGEAEIEKCILVCEYYAKNAETFLKPRAIQADMKNATVYFNPLGIVFAIMPWNFPFWQVFRFAIPAVMAGNAVLLKHASVTLGAGNKIDHLFKQAQFPSCLFQHVIVDKEIIKHIIEHPCISGITLTGSEAAGRSVASHAGNSLKKTVMELGGCDPYIILEDADLDNAALCIVNSRLNNSGQVCIAAKRVIAVQAVVEKLTAKIMDLISDFKMGNPLDSQTRLGPLARKDLRQSLHEQVEKTIKQGAKLLLGGIIPEGKGYYYPPTVLTGVTPGMCAYDEELFGPIIVITEAANEHQAVTLANQSVYGLGAAIFTQDLKKGEHIAVHEIEAGVCFVNTLVASDPRLPFGGIKRSGYGRELSLEGILEFVNVKTIAIAECNK